MESIRIVSCCERWPRKGDAWSFNMSPPTSVDSRQSASIIAVLKPCPPIQHKLRFPTLLRYLALERFRFGLAPPCCPLLLRVRLQRRSRKRIQPLSFVLSFIFAIATHRALQRERERERDFSLLAPV